MIETLNLPSSGSEAKRAGVSKYFTGKACHLGHLAPRYTQSGVCTECAVVNSARHRTLPKTVLLQHEYYKALRIANPEGIMWRSAKDRALKVGVAFSITTEDIRQAWPIDNLCPVLGTLMVHNFGGVTKNHSADSPSLDRIAPEDGYIKGNIVVMSMRANRIKSNETDPRTFLAMASWLERQQRRF